LAEFQWKWFSLLFCSADVTSMQTYWLWLWFLTRKGISSVGWSGIQVIDPMRMKIWIPPRIFGNQMCQCFDAIRASDNCNTNTDSDSNTNTNIDSI
jgi:hypothetical protein